MNGPREFLTVNLHLTQACNMDCVFCFAKYSERMGLDEREWQRCIEAIDRETSAFPKRKINFVGGEPTLLPFLSSLIRMAKELGFNTGLVTNGRLLNDAFLHQNVGHLDIVGLSIDSINSVTNACLGRSVCGVAWGADEYLRIIKAVRSYGYYLKINTVVSRPNVDEDLSGFMMVANPDRWKVMQCLIIEGQNDGRADAVAIDDAHLDRFIARHSPLACMVVERESQMRGSYVMVDPLGRPYGNALGKVVYGRPITEVGLLSQLDDLGYSEEKARGRGAIYG